jgi:hypothetical protein
MPDRRIEHPAKAASLPFDVWWALGEALAAAAVLTALRLLGVL